MNTLNIKIKDPTTITKVYKNNPLQMVDEEMMSLLERVITKLRQTEDSETDRLIVELETTSSKGTTAHYPLIEYSNDTLDTLVKDIADELECILDRRITIIKKNHSDCDLNLTFKVYHTRTLEDKQRATLKAEKDIQRIRGYMQILPITITETNPNHTEEQNETDETCTLCTSDESQPSEPLELTDENCTLCTSETQEENAYFADNEQNNYNNIELLL